MPKAMRVYENGEASVMNWEDVDPDSPQNGEVLVRHTAVGLNFIDVYFRAGVYPAPEFPFTPGLEGAGVVEATGSDVTDLSVGDRVAYASPPLGAYAEVRCMPADRVVKIPDDIDDETAAAMMLKGLTAQYLLRQVYKVQSGDTILFHAAAGGVGLIACQWAKHLGATVIGTVSTEEKAEKAAAHGCDFPILYTKENFVQRVQEITDGKGVPVVYDSVGLTTFEGSLDCLRPKGVLVSFGQSSGEIESFNPVLLRVKGSLFLTRPTLMTYTAEREDLVSMTEELISVITSGAVKISINQRYALSDAVQAHTDLESRKTQGATVLQV
ncbi:MAG: quinone oxidoreductase [Gammaproteobacteria bacterium]|nr:quinone oxidoreductase [Gammaproteobacteria bacterium]MYD77850.1 quinone oxidoreductase [Gammaproteobacteria bacterium]MYI89483.1 quinone oxidoreductase [Gammaproteobacteria bacterium]